MSNQPSRQSLPDKRTNDGEEQGNSYRRTSKSYNDERSGQYRRHGGNSSDNWKHTTQPPNTGHGPQKFDGYVNSGRNTSLQSNNRSKDFHKDRQRGRGAFTFGRNDSQKLISSNASSTQGVNAARSNPCNPYQKDHDSCEFDKSLNNLSELGQSLVETGSGKFHLSDNSTELSSSNDVIDNESWNVISKKSSCVEEIDDDLFSAPDDDVSLVHCVATDFRMGSGIAVKFRNSFPFVGKLLDQRIKPGGLAYIRDNKRYIFYLVTKELSSDKPTKKTMKSSLVALREKCQSLRVTKLAMPKIGCGRDGLIWDDVKEMLKQIFVDDFTITVYSLEDEPDATKNIGFKSRVENHDLLLKDIDSETGLLYIANMESEVSAEMQSLDEKHNFLNLLDKSRNKLGTAVFTRVRRETIYALFCKKSKTSPLKYESLEKAIRSLKYHHDKQRQPFAYYGIQAFEEEGDPYVMEKIDTLFRNSQIPATFWICWPPGLERPVSQGMSKVVNNWEESHENSRTEKTKSRQSNYDPNFSGSTSKSAADYNQKSSMQTGSKHEQRLPVSVEQCSAHRSFKTAVEESPMEIENIKETRAATEQEGTSDTAAVDYWNPDDSLVATEQEGTSDTAAVDHWNPDNSWEEMSYVENERRQSRSKRDAERIAKQNEKQISQDLKPSSCVTEYNGDLFEAEKTACLAHCVGADFRMGSGIAVIFRQTFGSVAELLQQRVGQGGVAHIKHEERYIFYLVTKMESTGKPTYGTLERSLRALHKKCKELNVTELAMPRIGCGLDRLDWKTVKSKLEEIFADGFAIRVYNLERNYEETPKSRPNTFIKIENLHLKDLKCKTEYLYIGCADNSITEDMKTIDEKFPFLMRLRKDKPKVGSIVVTEAYPKTNVIGLICRESPRDEVNFLNLRMALRALKKNKQKQGHSYFAVQAFEDGQDQILMLKFMTLLKWSYIDSEIWFCFPPNLKHLMPSSSSI